MCLISFNTRLGSPFSLYFRAPRSEPQHMVQCVCVLRLHAYAFQLCLGLHFILYCRTPTPLVCTCFPIRWRSPRPSWLTYHSGQASLARTLAGAGSRWCGQAGTCHGWPHTARWGHQREGTVGDLEYNKGDLKYKCHGRDAPSRGSRVRFQLPWVASYSEVWTQRGEK